MQISASRASTIDNALFVIKVVNRMHVSWLVDLISWTCGVSYFLSVCVDRLTWRAKTRFAVMAGVQVITLWNVNYCGLCCQSDFTCICLVYTGFNETHKVRTRSDTGSLWRCPIREESNGAAEDLQRQTCSQVLQKEGLPNTYILELRFCFWPLLLFKKTIITVDFSKYLSDIYS